MAICLEDLGIEHYRLGQGVGAAAVLGLRFANIILANIQK